MFLPRSIYLAVLCGLFTFILLGCQTGKRVAVIENGGDREDIGALNDEDVVGMYADTAVYQGYGPTTSNRVKVPVKYKYGTVISARPIAAHTVAKSTQRNSRSAAPAAANSSTQTNAGWKLRGILKHHGSNTVKDGIGSSNLSDRGGQFTTGWRTSEIVTDYRRSDMELDSNRGTRYVDSSLTSTKSKPTLASKSSNNALHSFIVRRLSNSSISHDKTGQTDVLHHSKSGTLDFDSKAAQIRSRNLSRSFADQSGARGSDLILSSTTILSHQRMGGTEPISVRRELARIFEGYTLEERKKSADVTSSSTAVSSRGNIHDEYATSYSSRTSLDDSFGSRTMLVVKGSRGHGQRIASRSIDIFSGLTVSAETHGKSRVDRSYHIARTYQQSGEVKVRNFSQRHGTQTRHAIIQPRTSYRINATNATNRVARPNIKLTKTVDKKSVVPGEVLTFTISYENVGDGPASNVTISDSLSQGVIYVHGSAKGKNAKVSARTTWSGVTQITWTIKKVIEPGERGFVSFKARVR